LSEEGLAVVRSVHRAYAEAGAEVLTANTFRTNLRAMRRAGVPEPEAARLVRRAVEQARQAREESGRADILIAGSVAPVEDCYHPEATPPDSDLRSEHRWMMQAMAEAGADLVLIETMCTVREAVISLDCARAAGLPACVSFVCRAGARVLDGEPLSAALAAVEPLQPEAVLVNCTEMKAVPEALRALREHGHLPIGVYPNLEDRSGLPEWTHVNAYVPAGYSEQGFAESLRAWIKEFHLSLVGGCCGSTPAHIQRLHDVLREGPWNAGGKRSSASPGDAMTAGTLHES
jgi:S-methylmethionine-dependent homocysteine/selenocysteine methylase